MKDSFMRGGLFGFWLPAAALVLTAGFLFWALCAPTDLATADLGRHITNGRLLFQNPAILKTNFYSYTYPDYPVLNHHWATGLIFYWIEKVTGFAGLRILYIILEIAAFAILGLTAFKKNMLPGFALGSLLALPLMAERTEIRPEIFSYLFAAVFMAVLFFWRDGRIKTWKVFAILAAVQILWVNLHIYFFLGPAIVCAFCLDAWFGKKNRTRLKRTTYLFAATLAVSFLNPFGANGVFEPFFIFNNYGYRVYENQSLGFLLNIFPKPILWYESGAILILACLTIWKALVAIRNKESFWAELFLITGFGGMAYLQLRNVSMFGLIFPFFFAWSLNRSGKFGQSDRDRLFAICSVCLSGLLAGVALGGGANLVLMKAQGSGPGLVSNDPAAADFIKHQGLSGPIFNNYDTGGYLIYYLYPEKVFVDNRPEAYPAEFFKDVYVPMQEKDPVWRAELKKYNFNLIVFDYRDVTPWSQTFLASRLADKEWAPVYVDNRILIFARRSDANLKTIERYEIPASRFSFTPFR